MPKLFIALVTATIVVGSAGLVWKAEAATITNVRGMAPLTSSYTLVEQVYWRRYYRRGYYGYARPYYGYGYYRPYPYYGYAYRPYGYYGGWWPGITIGIGPRWGWGY